MKTPINANIVVFFNQNKSLTVIVQWLSNIIVIQTMSLFTITYTDYIT